MDCTDSSQAFELVCRNGRTLFGNFHLPEKVRNAPVAIVFHGFKGFKDWGMFPYVADFLAEQGWAVVRFNFSHNGIEAHGEAFTLLDVFSRNTYSMELEDGLEMVAAVAEGRILPAETDVNKIALLGHSRGGGIAILAAAEDKRIRSLATWAAISKLDRWGEETKRRWRETGSLPVTNARTGQEMPLGIALLDDLERNTERFDLEKAASRLDKPWLIAHGEQDVSVPLSEGMQLYKWADKNVSELEVIPHADHTFGAVHPFRGSTTELSNVLAKTAFWLRQHTR